MTQLSAQEATYILAAITLVSGLIAGIRPFLERIPALSPTLPDQALHDAVLRALNFALNFGAVILSERTLGTLDWHNWLAYVTAAGGAAIGAHALYTLHTASHTNTLQRFIPSVSTQPIVSSPASGPHAFPPAPPAPVAQPPHSGTSDVVTPLEHPAVSPAAS